MPRSAANTSWLRLVPPARTPRSLGAGDQRIAEALHRAQLRDRTSLPRSAAPDGPGRPRTLEQIVAMKPPNLGWTQVFKQLKAESLLDEQTLGHVMARWGRPSPAVALRPGSELPGA